MTAKFTAIFVLTSLLAAFALVPATGSAQAWPVKTVRIVVPFAPGGASDTLGRIVGTKLGESLGVCRT